MEELFNGHGWRIFLETGKLPDGRQKTMARAERVDSVHLLAFTDDGRVLMLREFRPIYGTYIWMLPSGRIDIFIARDLTKDPLPQDAEEMIEVHELSLEEAIDNVLASKFVHTASAYALLRYLREKK